MQKLIEKMMPWANKIAGQRHLGAIRDAFIAFMPFLIVGSIFIIIQDFPIPAWQEKQVEWFGEAFNQFIILPKRATYDMMSLYISFLVAYKLSESYKVDKLSGGMLGLVLFLIVSPVSVAVTAEMTSVRLVGGWYGTNGVLVALFMGIIAAEIYRFIIQRGWVIKMPEGVPPGVAKAFSAIIPGIFIMIAGLIITGIFIQTDAGNIHQFIFNVVQKPLSGVVGNNVGSAIAVVFFISLFWFFGMNGGAIVNGIMRPFWTPLLESNLAAHEAGKAIPYILTEQFYDMIWIGGGGATLGVVLMLVFRAKSKRYQHLGRMSLAPGVFNINEPIMFGLPVVLSPILVIPLVVGPMVLAIINFYAMKLGIVAKPTGVVVPWPTPPLIQGYLITGSISGAALQLVDIVVVSLIWLPFIKVIDKMEKTVEEGKEE